MFYPVSGKLEENAFAATPYSNITSK